MGGTAPSAPSSPAECVVNISEGRDRTLIAAVAAAAGGTLLDLHSDPDHNRSVLTLGGALADVEEAARRVVAGAVARLDLTGHTGVHPRFGVADVVPFVPLGGTGGSDPGPALDARDRLARWAGRTLALPCFLYGPGRTLPEVRRAAFSSLAPDTGPSAPHPTAGASAVGARPVLVAYNVWIDGPDHLEPGARARRALSVARSTASAVRAPAVRTLGLPTGVGAQVSCNLVDPLSTGIDRVYDTVAALVEREGCVVLRAEVVGLVPGAVVARVPRHRWAELDLDEDRTIEARLATVRSE